MDIRAKRRLIFILYIVFVFAPLVLVIVWLSRYRASSLAGGYLDSWEAFLDLPVECETSSTHSGSLILRNFVLSTSSGYKVVLVPEMIVSDFGKGRVEPIEGLQFDLRDPKAAEELERGIERALRKGLSMRPPFGDLLEISEGDFRFNFLAGKMRLEEMEGYVRLVGEGRQINLDLHRRGSEEGAAPTFSANFSLGDKGELSERFSYKGEVLPFVSGFLESELFGNPQGYLEDFKGTVVLLKAREKKVSFEGTAELNLGLFLKELGLGTAEGKLSLALAAEFAGDRLNRLDLFAEENQDALPSIPRATLGKLAPVLGFTLPQGIPEDVGIEALRLSLSLEEGKVIIRGLLDNEGSWCILSDGKRLHSSLNISREDFLKRLKAFGSPAAEEKKEYPQ